MNGYVAYNGPSMIDGKPIKAVTTGTSNSSDNPKTGDMLQLWIMPVNSKPSDAVKNGDDVSVCGNCKHKPSIAKEHGVSPCYVRTWQAPNGVYKTTYPNQADNKRGAPMRLGAWGDPAALPYDVVESLVTPNHTGYTHQWDNPKIDARLKHYCMASVDSPDERVQAKLKGWRTFRVRKPDQPLMDGEIACPASKEASWRTQCADCGLCAGLSRQAKDVAIIEH
jgi:hypothetical protein